MMGQEEKREEEGEGGKRGLAGKDEGKELSGQAEIIKTG